MARRSSAPPPPGWDGRCLAKSKTSGKQCGNRAVPPTTKCRFHGGLSLRGPAHPKFKHGKDSSLTLALPAHLRHVFSATMNREDLVHLRGEISLLEAREVDLLGNLKAGGSTEFWKRAKALRAEQEELAEKLRRMNAKMEAGEAMTSSENVRYAKAQEELARITETLLQMIDRGAEDWEVWEDILETVETRRRLADTERKRLEMLQAYLTPDQALSFIGMIVNIIRDTVSDRRQVSEIAAKLQALLPSGQATGPSMPVMEAEVVEEGA